MTAIVVPDPEILKQVEEAFGKRLSDGAVHERRRHWPMTLRRLAAQAVHAGHSARTVAKVADVCKGSVLNWCKKEQIEAESLLAAPAIELKVVERRGPVEPEAEAKPEPLVVRILFLSGAVLECPVSALNAQLISVLNEVAP